MICPGCLQEVPGRLGDLCADCAAWARWHQDRPGIIAEEFIRRQEPRLKEAGLLVGEDEGKENWPSEAEMETAARSRREYDANCRRVWLKKKNLEKQDAIAKEPK